MSAHSDAESRIAAWLEHNHAAVERCRQVLADLRGGASTDFAMLSVAMRDVRAMHVEGDGAGEAPPGPAAAKPAGKKAKARAGSKGKAA